MKGKSMQTLTASPNPVAAGESTTISTDFTGAGWIHWTGPEAQGFVNVADGTATLQPTVAGSYELDLLSAKPHSKTLATATLTVT